MPVERAPIQIDPYTSTVPTVQVPQQEFGNTQPAGPLPGFFGGRNKSAGGLALGDSILKGFLQGHEAKAQKKAAQAQATLAAADAATSAAWQKYQDSLTSASGNVNDPGAKAAYEAYTGVFQKSKEAKAQFVIPEEPKKGATKGKDGKDPKKTGLFSNIGEWLSANPHVVPQLALLSMQPNKPGASPDTQRAMQEQARVQQETAQGAIELQAAQRKHNAQKVYDQYSGLSSEQLAALPPSQQAEFRSAQHVLNPPTTSGATKLYMLADGTKGWFHPDNVPEGAQPVEPPSASGGKIGSESDYATRYARENGIKPEQLTTADLDYVKERIAYDRARASSTSTTTTPGIDSTTSTSSRGIGPAPTPPRGRTWGGDQPQAAAAPTGGLTRPPAARRAGSMTRPPAAGASAKPGQPSAKRAQMTIAAETAKTSGIQSARQKLQATQDQNAKNKLYADNPQALKDANARAYATFQDEVKAAENAYDQKTIAMGGTPGKKPNAQAKSEVRYHQGHAYQQDPQTKEWKLLATATQ